VPAAAQLLVILAALVLFWAVVMRPARNQQRKVQTLQAELEVGDEVVLSAGIFGTVRSLTDTRAEVEVAAGVVLTVARQVVVRRVADLPDERPADQHPADQPHDATGAPGENDDRGPRPGQD
jgi:preprotein translocase subunit YajC